MVANQLNLSPMPTGSPRLLAPSLPESSPICAIMKMENCDDRPSVGVEHNSPRGGTCPARKQYPRRADEVTAGLGKQDLLSVYLRRSQHRRSTGGLDAPGALHVYV